MNKKMIVLLCIAGFFIATIALAFSFFYSKETPLSNKTETETTVNETKAEEASEEIEPEPELTETEQLAKDYAEEKYGFEVDVVEEDWAVVGAPDEVIVSPKNNKDISFRVVTDPSNFTVIEDDYHFALEADKEFQNLKPVLPAIGELGFTGVANTDIRISYNHDSVYLFLESKTDVSFENFAEENLDRYYELYRLIRMSEAKIGSYAVAGSKLDEGISLYWDPLAKLYNKEEFLILMKETHKEIINHEIESQYATEVKNLNNDRFNFGNHYDHTYDDPFDSWLYCTEVNEAAECTSAVLSVTYQEDKLNAGNPHLNEDLTSIFTFIETHLEPEIKIEFVYIDGKVPSLEKLEIGYEERMKYTNVEELIAFLLNE
ncbi:hypothetical protein [Planomicrobium okeanokoites]|uniref:hypothetical protein n=1 Tax=Planomicrobium okeanokoites TaxID=244 RepID=UPI000A005D84|nr:hypothetical protein [Planomicrobium okeanokoites]